MLAKQIAEKLNPVHERMDYYMNHMNEINSIIEEGNKKARKIAQQTMSEVRAAVNI